MNLIYNNGNYYIFDGKDNVFINREVVDAFYASYGKEMRSNLKKILYCNNIVNLRKLGYGVEIISGNGTIKVVASLKDGSRMNAAEIREALKKLDSLKTVSNESTLNDDLDYAESIVNSAFMSMDASSNDTSKAEVKEFNSNSYVNDLKDNSTDADLKSSLRSESDDEVKDDMDFNDSVKDYEVRNFSENDILKKNKVHRFSGIKSNKKFKIFKVAAKVVVAAIFAGTIVYGGISAFDFRANMNTGDYVDSHQITALNDVKSSNNVKQAKSPFKYDGYTKAYLCSDTLFASNGGTLPVGKFADNEYGLNHDITGVSTARLNSSGVGSIFKDFRNSEGLLDDFTVIYGHNIVGTAASKDSMFGKVADFADTTSSNAAMSADESYETTPSIDYYDEYGHYELDIFASGVYDALKIEGGVNGENAWVGNFSSEKDFQAKMKLVLSNSDIKTNVVPEYGDKIVCLSTCPYQGTDDYVNPNNRVLVFAKAKQLEKYKDLEMSSSHVR